MLKRGYATRKAAAAALRVQLSAVASGVHVRPNKVTVGEHFGEWLDGLRLAPSTRASYRKNVRLHVEPHIGEMRLDHLTGTRLTRLYRQLEQSGRADGEGGLSARTVRYIHTIVHSALGAAVKDGRLAVNPADKATPPSAREATAPEMHVWTGEQLAAFLAWSRDSDDDMYPAWLLLAMTGMRRGEALALEWRDVQFDAGTVAVRRSVTLVKTKGRGADRPWPAQVRQGASDRRRPGNPGRAARPPVDTGHDQPVTGPRHLPGARRAGRPDQAPGALLSHPSGPGRPGSDRAGRGHAARYPAARPAAHGGDADAARWSARQGGLGAARPRLGDDHLGRLYAHLPGMQREAAAKLAALVYGSA